MFGRRREPMTRVQRVRSELQRAAGYAMKSVGATVGPRAVAVRRGSGSALAALVSLAGTDQRARAMRAMPRGKLARNETPRSRRRWPKVAGLLAAGAAVGMAGAAVRRRRARQWDEYDPEHAFDVVHSTTGSSAGTTGAGSVGVDRTMDMAATGVEKATGAASSAMDMGGEKLSAGEKPSTGEKLSAALGSVPNNGGPGAQTAAPPADRAGEETDDLVTKGRSPSSNGHS